MQEIIERIFNELKDLNEGEVADYIPELAKVDPNKFAISVCNLIYSTRDKLSRIQL